MTTTPDVRVDATDTIDGTDGTDGTERAVGAFAERFGAAATAAFELATVELGTRLGLYAALARGPSTPHELAGAAGIDTRYAREWLEQQATAGIVDVESEPEGDDPDARRFRLSAAHATCLLRPDHPAYVAPLATFAVVGPAVLPELVEAFRRGTGVPSAAYGPLVRRAQAAINRPQFTHQLCAEWLPAMPDVVGTLRRGGARVADVGCGAGWSSVALATAFDAITVDGLDTDAESLADAARHAADAGVGDRTRFVQGDVATLQGHYDLVCCFEALHDMAHPVQALTAMRRVTEPDGTVFVVDERAADTLTADDPDLMQRLLYAVSVLHCLPVGRGEPDSSGTGAVMRTATLRRYATEAGFGSVEVLPIEHDGFRFYRLRR